MDFLNEKCTFLDLFFFDTNPLKPYYFGSVRSSAPLTTRSGCRRMESSRSPGTPRSWGTGCERLWATCEHNSEVGRGGWAPGESRLGGVGQSCTCAGCRRSGTTTWRPPSRGIIMQGARRPC